MLLWDTVLGLGSEAVHAQHDPAAHAGVLHPVFVGVIAPNLQLVSGADLMILKAQQALRLSVRLREE